MGNGELLYTTVEELSKEKGACMLGGIPETEAPNREVHADCIKHISSPGELLWSRKAIDHLDAKKSNFSPN